MDSEQGDADDDSLEERGVADVQDEDDDDWEEPDTVFVPYVAQIVVDVRLDEGVVLVDPPDGLFELIQPKKVERVVIRGLLPQYAESLRSKDGEVARS